MVDSGLGGGGRSRASAVSDSSLWEGASMFADSTLPPCFLAVLGNLRGCFTAPDFATFTALVAGLVAKQIPRVAR